MGLTYYEVIKQENGLAVDLMCLDGGQDPDKVEKQLQPEGCYILRRVAGTPEEVLETVGKWFEFYRSKVMTRERIGSVVVDSGMLMVFDPCYMEKLNSEECEELFNATINEHKSGQVITSLGLAFQTGYGNGVYDVFAQKDKNGRIVKIEIIMD